MILRGQPPPNADDECKGFLTPLIYKTSGKFRCLGVTMELLYINCVLTKRSCFFFRKFAKGGVEPAAGGKLSGNSGSFRMDGFLVGVCCCSKA